MDEFTNSFDFNKLEGNTNRIRIQLLSHFLLILYRRRSRTVSKVMTLFSTGCAPFIIGSNDNLPDDEKSRLVSSQSKHDQVSISPINAVTQVRIVVRRASLLPDKLHDFMFPLSWTV